MGQDVYLYQQNGTIMVTQFKSLIQLLDHFEEESTCIQYLVQTRWSGGAVCCPHCGNEKVYTTNRGYKCADKDCAKKFTVTTGTIFENTKISLRLWFAAIYLGTAHKKGISSLQLSRDLNITQKTAWFLLHRVREMLNENAPELLDGTVEVDETYIGGKNQNRHNNKKKENSTGGAGKTPVFGVLQRGGVVRAQVVKNTTGATLKPLIRKNVKFDSIMVSDENKAYHGLSLYYDHRTINHSAKEYVRGVDYTNTLEGYWSLLKRGIIGIYHNVSPKHLNRYCAEFSYRYNTRKVKDGDRFELAIKNVSGRRLTYSKLIS
ncbi:IS1595 family transposase [Cytophaga aurantiaca]|uniref:IS1595 family transposase n=1 Tax=Cytophaga aurantiaca TaxID=29530 RepID=UPI001FE047A1|nr:IS1595 family transposase [Cytophaga aurantiaca]